MLRPLKGPDSLVRSWGGYRSGWEPSVPAWTSVRPRQGGIKFYLTCSFLCVGVTASSSLRRILSPRLSLLILCDLFLSQSLGPSLRPFLFVGCTLAESYTLETSLSIFRTCVQSWFSRVGDGPEFPVLLYPWGSRDLGPNFVPATNWQSSRQDTCHFQTPVSSRVR